MEQLAHFEAGRRQAAWAFVRRLHAAGWAAAHADGRVTSGSVDEHHRDAAIDASEASALLAALDRMSVPADGTVPT
jgi:hypothetical protein